MDTHDPAPGSSVLLVHSNPNVRIALRDLLRQQFPNCRVKTAETRLQATRLSRDKSPAFALVDVDAPHGEGFATLRALRGQWPWLGLVALSLHPVEHFRKQALGAGATECACVALAEGGLTHLLRTLVRLFRGHGNGSALQHLDEALDSQATLLKHVIDSCPDCIKILDLDGNLRWMSGPGRRAMQIGAGEDIAGSPWLDNWGGEDRGMAEAALASAVDGSSGRFTGFCATAKGEPRWWDVIVTPLLNSDGQLEQVLAVSRDITELTLAQKRIHESDTFKDGILQAALDCIVTMDHDGKITEFNRTAETVFGHAREQAIGRTVEELLIPLGQRERHRTGMRQYLESGAPGILGRRVEMTALRADGTEFPVELSVTRLGDQWPPSFAGFMRDISALRTAQEATRVHARRQDLIAAFGHQALACRDIDTLLRIAVEVSTEGLGASLGHVLRVAKDDAAWEVKAATGWTNHGVNALLPESAQCIFVLQEGACLSESLRDETRFAPMQALLEQGVASVVQVPIMGADRRYGLLGAYSRQTAAFSCECLGFMRSIANIIETAIERNDSDDRLAYLSQFDSLTGLVNRNLLRERLGLVLAQSEHNGWKCAVLLVGIDHFKGVNETFGISAGDTLLKLLARRLQASVRPSDTVARMGSDEFAICCPRLRQADHASTVADKIARALATPFTVEGHSITVSVSLGIAVAPSDGTAPDELLQKADVALLRAKEIGRGCHQFFTPELNARLGRRMVLESALRRALQHGEFALHYQPQVCTRSGRIMGAEALIRWIDPDRGMVPPDEFIPVAEASGLIIPIGQWVIREACQEAVKWLDAGHPLLVAVNVSAAEVRHPTFITNLRATLLETGLPSGWLELELTESLAVDGFERFEELLGSAKDLGVSIAIDDFGTGYSSLSHLHRFPVDKVKIDRSFVSSIHGPTAHAPVVRAVIAVAHELGLKVVAEGVETSEQSAFVSGHDCDIAQGYLYARPCSPVDFSAMLEAGTNFQTLMAPPPPLVSKTA